MKRLRPGEMARLLEAELDNWLDRGLDRRTCRFRSELEVLLGRIRRDVLDSHAEEIEALEYSFNETAEKLAEVASEFNDWEEQAAELWRTIAAELEDARPDLSDVDVPQSDAPGATSRFVLFDSQRDYLAQMDAYNAWRDGDDANGDAP